jgi:UDP-N-acetylglucosamine acyltransferase
MTQIHPSSIVSTKAQIGKDVSIGPYCVIGDNVTLGDHVELMSHVVIDGIVEIGEGTKIHPFASIGSTPQILHFHGEPSKVIIGKNNTIREYVTIQPGTLEGGMVTSLGDNGLYMVGAHIGHDCKVGNNVVFANYASLGGHVEVGDFVRVGGLAAIHQRVRVGKHSMVGGVSALVRDLVPYGMAVGERAYLEGLNLIGMKRSGINNNEALEANRALSEIFHQKGDSLFQERVINTKNNYSHNAVIMEIVNFLLDDRHSRNLCGFREKEIE